ncbi:alpha/beta fold hydrolase [Streptomyces sp. H27-D2]|uniref:alpha/beta fold hydrolase n=1 Tax=Streptomyces sp. H27-D2 TaxID=3046304 RepID=UPI002DB9DE8A|nr:alpha/beta fold hydrolase [Streptomyces sp. H27-D2]MEC4015950.1 alpha/beta fold hydrolase [Streptomyces sp. H27-D2]
MTQIPAAPATVPAAGAPTAPTAHAGTPALATTVTGSGPGILLAHGAGGSIEGNYGPLVPALADGHTVVAPDYPGSGATPRSSGPLTLDGLADALVESATAAGVETFTLVGFSLGTAVSVRAAARHPERVRGLVLTAGLARPDHRTRTSLTLWQDFLACEDFEGFARFIALAGFGEDFLNALPDEVFESLLTDIAAGVPAGAAEQAALVAEVDTTADLAGISAPTLIIAPTQDTLVSPANSRFLADGIPGAAYAEIATGHVAMAERPAEWQALVADFLAKHSL